MSTVTIRNPPSAENWERIAADAQHVENFVNATTPAVLVTPGGSTRPNLAKVQADAFANYGSLNPRGAWVTATAYAVRDLYTSGGVTYLVVVAHAAGASVAADLAAGLVVVFQGALLSDVAARLAIDQNLADLADKGAALKNVGLIDNNSPISITAATTLTLSQLNRGIVIGDSGSPVNFTVTLPSSAPIGALVKIRVSSTATKLYTLNGGDVGIDGVAERVLWRGESALLERVSGSWIKIGGVSRPIRGHARRTSAQSLTAATVNRVLFDAAAGDSTALNLWWDAANSRVIAPRANSYWHIVFNAVLAASATITHTELGIQRVNNDATAAAFNVAPPGAFVDLPNVAASGARICCSISAYYAATVAGGWHGVVRPTGANASVEYVAGTLETSLMITEIPLW